MSLIVGKWWCSLDVAKLITSATGCGDSTFLMYSTNAYLTYMRVIRTRGFRSILSSPSSVISRILALRKVPCNLSIGSMLRLEHYSKYVRMCVVAITSSVASLRSDNFLKQYPVQSYSEHAGRISWHT